LFNRCIGPVILTARAVVSFSAAYGTTAAANKIILILIAHLTVIA